MAAENSRKYYCFVCGVVKSVEPVSYHRFPKDDGEIESWLNFFGLPFDVATYYQLQYMRLCSRHFQPEDFKQCQKTGKKILLSNIAPSIKLNENETFRKCMRLSNSPKRNKRQKSSANDKTIDATEGQPTILKKHWPRTCVVCRLQSQSSLSYFRFPKDSRRKAWLVACGIDSVTDEMRLCSNHFTMECFARAPGVSRRAALKNTAVPTLFLSEISVTVTQNNEVKVENIIYLDEVHSSPTEGEILENLEMEAENIAVNAHVNWAVDNEISAKNDEDPLDTTCSLTPREIYVNVVEEEANDGAVEIVFNNIENDLEVPDLSEFACQEIRADESLKSQPAGTTSNGPSYAETPRAPIRTPRYPGDVRSHHLSSPKSAEQSYAKAMTVINKQRQKLKVAHQKIRRQDKRLLQLKDFVNELHQKNLINADISESLLVIIGKRNS